MGSIFALVVVFVLVPWVSYRAVGAPAPSDGYGRWAVLSAPLLFVALLAVRSGVGEATAIAVGAAASVALAASSVMRARRFRRLDDLCAQLGKPNARDALDALDAELKNLWRGAPPRRAAPWTLYAVARAIRGGHAARALQWLDLVAPARLVGDLAVSAAQYRASACLRTGDAAGARRALEGVPRAVRAPAFEETLEAMRALVGVLEGDAAAGNHAVGALAKVLAPTAELTWHAVRAHALALEHRDEDLRAALARLRQDHGDEPLERIAAHRGPASAEAAALLASDAPYR